MNLVAVVDGNSVVVDRTVSPASLTDDELSLNRSLVESWIVGKSLGRSGMDTLTDVLDGLVWESDSRLAHA